MFKKMLMLGGVAVATLAAVPASAALFTFDLTGSRNASFTIDSETVPSNATALQSQFANVAGTFGGVAGVARTISFGATTGVSAFEIVGGGNLGFSQFSGPLLFTGPTSNPVFNTGTFQLSSLVAGRSTLTISAAAPGAVPEPAAWAMMISGFGLVGGAMRRRTTGARALA